jgi:hypothetical protein
VCLKNVSPHILTTLSFKLPLVPISKPKLNIQVRFANRTSDEFAASGNNGHLFNACFVVSRTRAAAFVIFYRTREI